DVSRFPTKEKLAAYAGLEPRQDQFRSAEKLKEINTAPKIHYSLEMAIELSLKGLLLFHGIDYSKTHNILRLVIRLI
ncbi:MAG: HEPN domain-containing protein, partial [Thermoplasmata archaeon]